MEAPFRPPGVQQINLVLIMTDNTLRHLAYVMYGDVFHQYLLSFAADAILLSFPSFGRLA